MEFCWCLPLEITNGVREKENTNPQIYNGIIEEEQFPMVFFGFKNCISLKRHLFRRCPIHPLELEGEEPEEMFTTENWENM
jgi:hypothetical protein